MQLLNASQSIAWLRGQICTPSSAVNDLSKLLALTNVLDSFRQCFPREFKKYERGIGQMDSERIIVEFLRLVHSRLFELNEVYLEDEESYVYACTYIPISSFTPDWYNEHPADLPMVEKVILLLDGALDYNGMGGEKAEMLSGLPLAVHKSLTTPAPIELPNLQRVCQQARGPLRNLDLATEIVFKASDNIWLHITDEEYSEIPWGIDEVRSLAKQYREAIALMARFRKLDGWLQADPEKRIPKVVALWMKARKKTRVKVPAAPPLVDVLTRVPVMV